MTATVTYDANLRTTCLHLQSGSSFETDAPSDNKGQGARFSPTDLIATGLGACLITTMGIKAESMDIKLDGAKVEVEEVRKISSVETDKSFYIAPAESREIIIKSDSKEEKISEQTQVNTPKETTPVVMSAPKPTGPVYYEHEVETGETLFKIAKVYQVSVDDLIRWNNLGKSPKIRVGQKIKLKP